MANDGEPGLPASALGSNMRNASCDMAGSYAARNVGIAQASGLFCLFTDADCLPPPGWIAAHIAAARHHDGPDNATANVLVAGPVRMVPPAPDATWATRFWACYDLVKGIPQDRYVTEGMAATANLLVPLALFATVGGFDPSRFSGGDGEFCRRARSVGATLNLAAEAWTGHPCRSTWSELATKARRVSAAELQLPGPNRRTALLRRLTPPLRAMLRFAKSPAPFRHRAVAIFILFPLWAVELSETVRVLVFGRMPERR